MNAAFNLSGKLAIVTGGGSGIGLGIARALAKAGADIALCGRRLSVCETACAEIRQTGVAAEAFRCDVSQQNEVEAMVAAVIERFGRIDILVNNAGIAGAAQPFLDITLEQWRQTIDINLTGMFLCSQAVGRHMVREGHGKIINVASVGSFLPLPCSADYSASKGGVMMLTRAMALELIRHNIQVNAVCPGYITTELKQDTIERVAEKAARKVPAGRIGRSEEVAGVVVFLASSASDYMVGSSVVIDGGIMLK
ncbi:MAG: glucose 1-dehydrogenase [Sphingomonadales bacterium]|nr:glucose 1-dehydrogenase [Sphingomonadales bacterium]